MWYKCVGEQKEEKDIVINLEVEDVVTLECTCVWFLCQSEIDDLCVRFVHENTF